MRNPFTKALNRKEKRVIKGVLTDVEVELISLLFDDMKPANKKGYVAKSEGSEFKNIGSSIKVTVEKGEKEGRIYVTVMEPGVKDTEGDSYSAEEVLKACEHFAKKGLVRKNDVNHDMQPVDEFYISQSYILKTEDKAHFPETAIGAWVAVVKCDKLDSPLWQKVDEGKFNGVSIFGKAVDTGELGEKAAGEVKQALDGLTQEIKNLTAAGEKATEEQIKGMQAKIDALQKQAEGEEQKAAFTELSKAIKELGEAVSKGINRQIPGEPDGGGTNMEDIIKTAPDGTKVVVKAEKKELYKALSDIYAGDKMQVLTGNLVQQFLDAIIGMGTDFLGDLSILPITKAGTVDTGLLSDVIFYNNADSQVLQSVSTGNLSMGAQILHSALTLNKATLEYYKDALGSEEAFGAYIEQAMATKIRKALQEIVFAGKRSANAGTNVAAMDGIIEKASDATDVTTISVDDTTNPDAVSLFTDIMADFDEAVLQSPNFRFYVSNTLYLHIVKDYCKRESAAGDGFLLNGGQLTFLGKEIKVAPMQSNLYVCAGDSKMAVLGYINDVELKIEHAGATFNYTIYTRSNWGVNYVSGKFNVYLMSAA